VAAPIFHERYPDRWNRFEAWTAQHLASLSPGHVRLRMSARALWGVGEVCSPFALMGGRERGGRERWPSTVHFVDDYEPAKPLLDTVLGRTWPRQRSRARTPADGDIAVQ